MTKAQNFNIVYRIIHESLVKIVFNYRFHIEIDSSFRELFFVINIFWTWFYRTRKSCGEFFVDELCIFENKELVMRRKYFDELSWSSQRIVEDMNVNYPFNLIVSSSFCHCFSLVLSYPWCKVFVNFSSDYKGLL